MKKLSVILTIILFNLSLFAQTAPGDAVGTFRGNDGTTYTFKTTGTDEGNVWGGAEGIYTDDSRLGKAAVHAGLLKIGQTGTVSVVILGGMGSYKGSTRNGISTSDYGDFSGSFKFAAAAAPSNMTTYRGNNGSTYTFTVTGSNTGSVWGGSNGIYSDDSYLPAAAVHAGLLDVGETGNIKVTVMKGQPSYSGTTRNGITSNNYGSWLGSYSFGEKYIESVINAPNNVREYRGEEGKVFTFRVVGTTSGSVWGGSNGVYTDDSQLSSAAVHAGKVKIGQEAIIKVRIMDGQSSYKGSTKNGVVSNDYGRWDGSFKFE